MRDQIDWFSDNISTARIVLAGAVDREPYCSPSITHPYFSHLLRDVI